MSLTQTEKMGFSKNVLELVSEEASVLEKAGYDAHKIGEILTVRYEAAAKANARQEDLKRQLKEATAEVEALTDALYRSASGYLDAAKNFQRLRSRVRMPGDQVAASGEAPAVEPVLEGPK
jgi:hypothetical protein